MDYRRNLNNEINEKNKNRVSSASGRINTNQSATSKEKNQNKNSINDELYSRLSKTPLRKNKIVTPKVVKVPKTKEVQEKEERFFHRMSITTLEKDKLAKKAKIAEIEYEEKVKRSKLLNNTTDFVNTPIFQRLSTVKLEKQIFYENQKKEEEEFVYKKKKIVSKTLPSNVKTLLNRLKNHDEAQKHKIEELRKLKHIQEMSEIRDPEINNVSRSLITNTTFSERQEIYKLKKETKITELKQYSEKKLKSFINSNLNNLKVDPKTIDNSINRMIQWGEEKKKKRDQQCKESEDKKMENCTFRPALNPKSLKMIYKDDIITKTLNNYELVNNEYYLPTNEKLDTKLGKFQNLHRNRICSESVSLKTEESSKYSKMTPTKAPNKKQFSDIDI